MLSAAGAGAHTKAPAATDWVVQAQNPRDRMYSKNERMRKKLHLLWKPKSTSRCEYYKAFIYCSFIVFPPISGELLPSSGHCVNSLTISIPRLFPQGHETLQQGCIENCRQDGAGINLKVLPGKQSTELIQTHHLVPFRVSASITDFESNLMGCVKNIVIIIIIIKCVHHWQASGSSQSLPLLGSERIHLIWNFEHPGIVGSVLSNHAETCWKVERTVCLCLGRRLK